MALVKKNLLYIIGGVVLLGIIGYCSSENSIKDETHIADVVHIDSMIVDYDKGIFYCGEYVFEAILTDSTSNQSSKTFIISVEGVDVNVSYDNKDMYGYISEDLSMNVLFNENDFHSSYSAFPQNQEGTEWKGELRINTLSYQIVMKLKDSKKTGEIFNIKEYYVQRFAAEDAGANFEDEDTDSDIDTDEYSWLQGHWVYEQGGYKGHFIIQGNTITQYSSMNPEKDTNTFIIDGDVLRARLIDGMDLVVQIDFTNRRIDYGEGMWMHKVK